MFTLNIIPVEFIFIGLLISCTFTAINYLLLKHVFEGNTKDAYKSILGIICVVGYITNLRYLLVDIVSFLKFFLNADVAFT